MKQIGQNSKKWLSLRLFVPMVTVCNILVLVKKKNLARVYANTWPLYTPSVLAANTAAWTFLTQWKAFLRAYYVDTKEHGNARPSICRSQANRTMRRLNRSTDQWVWQIGFWIQSKILTDLQILGPDFEFWLLGSSDRGSQRGAGNLTFSLLCARCLAVEKMTK